MTNDESVVNLTKEGIPIETIPKKNVGSMIVDVAGICEVCERGILVPITSLENEKGRTMRRYHSECRKGRKNRKRLK